MGTFAFDRWQIDPVAGVARGRGTELRLTTRERDLLAYLHRHAGHDVDRDTLHREVWGHRETVVRGARISSTAARVVRSKSTHAAMEAGDSRPYRPTRVQRAPVTPTSCDPSAQRPAYGLAVISPNSANGHAGGLGAMSTRVGKPVHAGVSPARSGCRFPTSRGPIRPTGVTRWSSATTSSARANSPLKHLPELGTSSTPAGTAAPGTCVPSTPCARSLRRTEHPAVVPIAAGR